MPSRKIDILLVREDGPVQTMRIGPWLLRFFLVVMVLILAALAGGGYLLYQQNLAVSEIVKDNRRLKLAAENMETMVRGLQDRAFLANTPGDEPPPPPKPQPVPPEPKAAIPKATPQASRNTAAETDTQAKENGSASTPEEAQGVEPWPTSSDWVEVSKIRRKQSGRDLLVYFDIANKLDRKHPAEGYATVLLRSQRKGTPWVEAWPPIRLTPLGRPEKPKKGAYFTVRSYKRFKARFALVDKQVEAIDFLIYNKEGELSLMMREPVESKNSK